MFTNSVNNDFTLLSSSPAIDTGNNSNVIGTTDLLGNVRIHNTTVDMGAYEFGAAILGMPSYNFGNVLTIFPNPTSSILNVQTNEPITQIDIFTLEGKQILNTKQKKIDVSNLPSGLYLIKITCKDDKQENQKFFKQ